MSQRNTGIAVDAVPLIGDPSTREPIAKIVGAGILPALQIRSGLKRAATSVGRSSSPVQPTLNCDSLGVLGVLCGEKV